MGRQWGGKGEVMGAGDEEVVGADHGEVMGADSGCWSCGGDEEVLRRWWVLVMGRLWVLTMGAGHGR